MLINLAFIKAANGLFYYALDYVAALEAATSVVLVRTPLLAAAVRQRFPSLPLRVVQPFGAARAVVAAARSGEVVFTPSSHPIPFGGRQLVVMHDSFPFDGLKGRIKAALFFLAMRTSQAIAGYINVSDARSFLERGGLPAERMISAPNRIALPPPAVPNGKLRLPDHPVIGLFGTDCPKKNYERLFASIVPQAGARRLRFRLYGQPNAYAARIIATYSHIDIEVTDSAITGLDLFLSSIDLVASAATREGFGRPTALALARGVPCWLVDAPVYREFFSEAATLHPDVEALGAALATLQPGRELVRPTFAMQDEVEHDFRRCIAWLLEEDSGRS
jgi:hypothetical protein